MTILMLEIAAIVPGKNRRRYGCDGESLWWQPLRLSRFYGSGLRSPLHRGQL